MIDLCKRVLVNCSLTILSKGNWHKARMSKLSNLCCIVNSARDLLASSLKCVFVNIEKYYRTKQEYILDTYEISNISIIWK